MGSAKNLDFGPRILTYKMSNQMNSETYKNMSPLVWGLALSVSAMAVCEVWQPKPCSRNISVQWAIKWTGLSHLAEAKVRWELQGSAY